MLLGCICTMVNDRKKIRRSEANEGDGRAKCHRALAACVHHQLKKLQLWPTAVPQPAFGAVHLIQYSTCTAVPFPTTPGPIIVALFSAKTGQRSTPQLLSSPTCEKLKGPAPPKKALADPGCLPGFAHPPFLLCSVVHLRDEDIQVSGSHNSLINAYPVSA